MAGRTAIVPTGIFTTPEGVFVRYDVLIVDEAASTSMVLARTQETAFVLPEPLQKELNSLLHTLGKHMEFLSGIGEASALEKASGDETLDHIPPEDEEL